MPVFTRGAVPWNSLDDNTRLPLTSELESGYPCGQADQKLFNFTAGYSWGQVHNVIVRTGATADRSDLLQLSLAIQSGLLNYADASGTANALTVTLPLPPDALFPGLKVRFKASASNTGAVTLNANGLGVKPLTGPSGRALTEKEILSGAVIEAMYDGTKFIALSGLSDRALVGTRMFSTPGSVSFTVPDGVTLLDIQVWGAGGGGGGSAGETNGSGGGGGSGGYCRKRIYVTPGQVITGTVGAGGNVNIGANGGTGGNSSISGMTAGGGGGGLISPASYGGGPGTAAGGDFNIIGSGGSSGFQTGYFIGGMGSGAPFGGGGGGGGYTDSYVGGFPGGGGGGAGGATVSKAGARGADGCILITW